ncbi:hypothetical protein [Mesoterricola silvestris]|uniref:Uncharacterized protein n=1 Tax=Mesoterricola silvestris TaxID=2927979 RepID=A0AA48GXU2_9BACT|nr:hypothetical protein [Mesoterricola silvestris]BDU72343.1 hypothetical protein METEAL_15170 [Mesoterricola silvestris]
MTDIASLTIKVETKEVEAAIVALNRLRDAANEAREAIANIGLPAVKNVHMEMGGAVNCVGSIDKEVLEFIERHKRIGGLLS